LPLRKLVFITCSLITLGIVLHASNPVSAQGVDDAGRPLLTGEQTSGTEHFLLHFTLEGENAVDPTDTNEDSVPDYIELVAETLEDIYEIEINEFGWSAPPDDGILGGDERIDVYFENILAFGIAGYVSEEGGFVRDNPNSSDVERNAAFSYMSLDNDYIEAEDPEYDVDYTPIQLMQATAAHEFNHVLQMGYDSQDIHGWLYEATATWMEDEVYDDVNDGLYYIDEVFFSPDTCLVSGNSELGYGLRWYGSWLFLRHLSETYDQQIIEDIWAYSRQLNGFEAIDRALAPFGSALEVETLDYATSNLLLTYQEGDSYLPVLFEGEAVVGESYFPVDGVQSLGVDYIRIVGEGVVDISVRQADFPSSMRVVGIRDDGQADVIDQTGDSVQVVVNLNQYEDTFLIFQNNERVADGSDCESQDYEIDVRRSDFSPSPPVRVASTENFVEPVEQPIIGDGPPPFIGELQGDDVYADRPEELEADFGPIIPQNLPEGYAFDYGYITSPSDFGADEAFYLPAGEDGASFDYINSDGNWIGIIQSASPYTNLDEYFDERDYVPEEDEFATRLFINGVDVILEDLSGDSSPFYSATLIFDDLFIVIDGDKNSDDVLAMVDSLTLAAETGAFAATPPPVGPPTFVPPPPPSRPPGGIPPAPAQVSRSALVGMGLLGLSIFGFAFCIGIVAVGGVVLIASQMLPARKQIPSDVKQAAAIAKEHIKAETDLYDEATPGSDEADNPASETI